MIIKVYAYTFHSNYQLSQFISDSEFPIMVKCHNSAALTNAHSMGVGNEGQSLPLEHFSGVSSKLCIFMYNYINKSLVIRNFDLKW